MQHDMTTEFYELQRFTQRWIWGLLIFLLLIQAGVFGYGLYQQLVLGQPWGDRPMSDMALILTSIGIFLFSGGMSYLFYSLRLITEVRPEGLAIQFYPLHRKVIPYHRIKSCQARSYKPIREYGGWGIKFGPGGRAYNVSGDRGVQLVLDDGKRILIGSQRSDELERAIKRHGVG